MVFASDGDDIKYGPCMIKTQLSWFFGASEQQLIQEEFNVWPVIRYRKGWGTRQGQRARCYAGMLWLEVYPPRSTRYFSSARREGRLLDEVYPICRRGITRPIDEV